VRLWFDAQGGFQAQLPAALEQCLRAGPADPGLSAIPAVSDVSPAQQRVADADDLGVACPSKWSSIQEVVSAPQPLCVVKLVRGARAEHLLSIYCEDPALEVFSSAKLLRTQFLGYDTSDFHSEDVTHSGDQALWTALRAGAGPWASKPACLVTVGNGRHAGLRAVGVGSNQKKRERAVSLALAVTAILHTSWPSDSALEEACTGNAAELLQMVRLIQAAQQATIAGGTVVV